MSLGAKRICPVCRGKFDPVVEWQVCDTIKCKNVLNVRRFRARKRGGGDDNGGGKRQMALFSKRSVSAKRVKPPRPETAPLFTMSANGRHEKHVPLPDTQLYTLPVIGHCEDAEEQPFAPQVALPKPVQPVGVDLGGLDAAA